MLSHVFVGITDFERAFGFYGVLMETLGLRLKFRDEDACWAGWMPADAPRPLFVISRPHDGRPATVGNGQMLALLATDRATVDRAHAGTGADHRTAEAADAGARRCAPEVLPDHTVWARRRGGGRSVPPSG